MIFYRINILYMQSIENNITSETSPFQPSEETVPIKEKAADVMLQIDLRKMKKSVFVKNVSQKFHMGPFYIETGISGDYNLLTRKGFITCRLNLIKPFQLQQTLYLVDSLLKVKYQTSILQLISSFGLSPEGQLRQFLDISILFELTTHLFEKDWALSGSLKSDKYKFTIFKRQFGINEIGYKLGGKKGKIQQNKVFFIFDLANIPLKVWHSFGKEYLLEGQLQVIPFGKLISNLTDGIQSLDIASVLQHLQLKKNVFKFKNFSNFSISSNCSLGTCQLIIKQGKFTSEFSPPTKFTFKDISAQIQFLDFLGLDKIKIQANNRKQGFRVEGALAIGKIKPLAQLVDMLSSGLSKSLILPFILIIYDWKLITVKLGLIRERKINDSIKLDSLDLLITPIGPAPEFGIQGQISAKLCGHDFIFKASFTVGVVVKLTAQMVGTWDKPLGLNNSQVKDLLLQITSNGFGAKGQVKLGDMSAKIAASFDYLIPSRNMFYFELKQFEFTKVLSVFGVSMPGPIASILNIISIKLMQVKMVSPGGMKLGDTYYQQGFSAKLDCKIFGFQAKFALEYNKNNFTLYGEIDPIEIPHILKLKSSAHKQKGPSFDVKLGSSASSHFRIDGLLSVLDLIDLQVYASVDAKGIVFYARSALKIFGLNFMEGTFTLNAGLLNFSNNFIAKASFKTDTSTFQAIQKFLKEEARKASKAFEEAKKKLADAQAKFDQARIKLNQQQQKQKTKVQNAKNQFSRILKQRQSQAKAVFEREKARATQALNKQKKRAHQELQRAKSKAEKAHSDEQARANKQLNDQKIRAEAQLKSAQQKVSDSFKGPQKEVDRLNAKIRQYRRAKPWQIHKKIALGGLYLARETALAVLKAAQEVAKGTLSLADKTYQGMLQASKQTYSATIEASKQIASAAIKAADKTYEGTLKAAQATYNEALSTIQKTYDAALKVANEVATKAADALIAAIDLAFTIAQQAVQAASKTLDIAKQAVKAIQAVANFAVDFLIKILNGLASMLTIRQLSFEFDVKLKTIKIKIDLTILGKNLKTSIQISFEQIADFINMLAQKIWSFISGK